MHFEEITSKDNPKIKQTVKLINSAKERTDKSLFVAEGIRLCCDAVRSGIEVKWLMFNQMSLKKYADKIEYVSSAAEKCYMLSDKVFEKITDTESTQGLVCVCEKPNSIYRIDLNGKYVAIENLSNPLNLGAIARTAEALGLSGMMLIGKNCDPYSEKALRASMGSLLRFKLFIMDYDEVANCISKGMKFYCSVADRKAESVNDIRFSSGSVIIIGNEGNGISDKLKSICNYNITIPISGKTESFNAAAAAAILLWEFMK